MKKSFLFVHRKLFLLDIHDSTFIQKAHNALNKYHKVYAQKKGHKVRVKSKNRKKYNQTYELKIIILIKNKTNKQILRRG